MPCEQSLIYPIVLSARFPLVSGLPSALFENVMPEFAIGSGSAQFVVAVCI